jgi:hypothetical protein
MRAPDASDPASGKTDGTRVDQPGGQIDRGNTPSTAGVKPAASAALAAYYETQTAKTKARARVKKGNAR